MRKKLRIKMRKEIVFAIIAGIFFGLLVAFGIWRANTTLKNGHAATSQNSTNEETSTTPTSTPTGIAISKPLSNQVFTSPTAEISGLTDPDSYVVVSTDKKDVVGKSDVSGEFRVNVTLSPGINIVTTTSFGKSGQASSQAILLVLSSEFPENQMDNEENTSTASANDIREKVQEKVNKVMMTPTAYVGNVTDIAENAIQISNFVVDENGNDKPSEIKLVSTSDTTTYVDIKDKTKDLKSTDVAIGDFIAALGYKNDNDVLDTKRILVTTKPDTTKYSPLMGKITSIEGKDITIQSSSVTYSLQFAKTWDGPEVKELSENENIIVVGVINDDLVSDIRTLYVVKDESAMMENPQ